jgi:uncharacterized protein YndB with AHSA1/START domain
MTTKIEPTVEKGNLVLSRTIDAPRESVFQAWIDPKQLKNWWGPHLDQYLVLNPRLPLTTNQ